jgi:CDP-diacylglycerol--serine O-phosphatidyltransferase
VELDSLSDVVSFGVAPSYLVYVLGLDTLGPLGLIVAALPALCGAVRLARFNVSFTGEKKDTFEGLPIPGQAIALVALVLAAEQGSWLEVPWLTPARVTQPPVLVAVVAVLSGLMVSAVDFDAIPKPTVEYARAHPRKMAAYSVALVVVVALQAVGLVVVVAAYLALGVGRATYRLALALTQPLPGEQGKR